jgi:two-component system alkaline phosphatase synthesis response regulator PhoP
MGQRILVVDDEQSIRTIVEYALKDAGFEVVTAGRGDEALAVMDRDPVDLVVLDVMLPGMDGLEVCQRIRAERSVPIIMLSARGEELDKVLGLELGAERSTRSRGRSPARARSSTSPSPSSRSC